MENKALIKNENGVLEIGNAYIARRFTADGAFKTVGVVNRCLPDSYEYRPDGGEEFVISLSGRFKKYRITASMLCVKSVKARNTESGAELIAEFEPYRIASEELSVTVLYSLGNSDFFLRKQLFINNNGRGKLRLDSIDCESLALKPDSFKWSCPECSKVFLSPYHSRLGQPVYFDSFFAGYEFPLCNNDIKENTAVLRRFSGKRLSEICREGKGFFDFSAVLGCADGTGYENVRRAFFAYVDSFAIKDRFTLQYNSWYDHMMDIDEEKIIRSFTEIEKGMTSHGIRPLDAYVIDDGWNDYGSDFWSFNEKFPDGLKKISRLCKALGSDTGLWLGPRGGYNYNRSFAKRIARAGKGSFNKNSGDICVADKKYIENTLELMHGYADKYGVSYWKLDGFLLKGCHSRRHAHPFGGEQDMYCYTACWEEWLKGLEKLAHDKPTRFNLTCYTPASPWILRYAESVWIGNSDDVGYLSKGKNAEELCDCDADRMLSYRDGRYYDFVNTRQYQLPIRYLYNHEPIFAHRAECEMTDAQFRNYLYMLAMRGNALWEMYLSYDLMTENKWQILAEVTAFAEENHDVLRNSMPIGGNPENGEAYGYFAFDGKRGFLAVRNPSKTVKEFDFTLDGNLCLTKTDIQLSLYEILPSVRKHEEVKLGYGSKLNLKIPSGAVLLFELRGEQREDKPSLVYAKKTGNNCTLLFDRPVLCDEKSFTFEGEALSFSVGSDRRLVTVEGKFQNKADLTLCASDVYGGVLSGKLSLSDETNGKITDGSVADADFTLCCTLENAPSDGLLLSVSNRLAVSAVNGCIQLNIAGVKLRSKTEISGRESVELCIVREKNTALRLYIDSKPDCTAYVRGAGFGDIPVKDARMSKCVVKYDILNRALAFDEV